MLYGTISGENHTLLKSNKARVNSGPAGYENLNLPTAKIQQFIHMQSIFRKYLICFSNITFKRIFCLNNSILILYRIYLNYI